MTQAGEVAGYVAAGYERVSEAFAANFRRSDDYREIGAALAVYRDGDCIVDLWGGSADVGRTRPWQAGTLVNVWSTTKGATAACIAKLVDNGALRYDDAVASVWPEFGQNGKQAITVAQVMSHQSGLAGFAVPTSIDELYDWELICGRLAEQPPAWPPGTATAYHAVTFGFLAGEIVRRVDGRTLGRFFADEFAVPLGADVFIGLPEELEGRVAELAPPRSPVDIAALDLPDVARAALANPPMDATRPNDRIWRAVELPALNGQASAQGIARLYAALLHTPHPGRPAPLSPAGVAAMTVVATDRDDLALGFKPMWGMGVAHNATGMFGPNPRAFGHSGWGGSFGCADPDAGIAIGYVCSQMGSELVGDPRAMPLCKAIFQSAAS